MKTEIKITIHIANITFSGRVPGITDITLKQRGIFIKNGWRLVNENRNPTLIKRYKGLGFANLFNNGKFIIFAVKSKEKGILTANNIILDCKKVKCIH